MKKKILLALLVATAALAGVGFTHKIARADVGDRCTTEHGRSGYMVASGEGGEVCVADEGGSSEE